MKKKPHQKQSAIKSVFSEFRNRLYKQDKHLNGNNYEVKKNQNGYTLVIHKERGANEELYFESKTLLNNYLETLNH